MSDIQSALDQFAEAAILPDHWEAALNLMADATNSLGATLVLRRTTPRTIAVSSTIRPCVEDYMRFPAGDPREARVQPQLAQGFLTDADTFTREEIAHNPYYQEFLRPRGFGWNAAARLGGELIFSVKRGLADGPYDGDDLAALNRMLPWLRAASRVASLAWRSRFQGELEAFERIGRAAVLLNRDQCVVAHTASLPFGDGLDLTGRHLRAASGAEQRKLQCFVECLTGDHRSIRPLPSMITLSRPSGMRRLVLDGTASSHALRSLHSDAIAIVLVTDPERAVACKIEHIASVFDLTPTEARLAAEIGAGESVEQAASKLNISVAHARQRLKSIFTKTGTGRQHELAAVLSRIR